MSSSDEEAASPVLGASGSKDRAPIYPLPSESECDEGRKNKSPKYKRPRAMWTCVSDFQKGDEAEMDDDEMKARIFQKALEYMEASMIYKLGNHRPGPNDYGMWKLIRGYPFQDGMVSWYRCSLRGRFGCNAEIKITYALGYMSLEKRGEHNDDSHHPSKVKSKYLKVKQIKPESYEAC